MIRFIVDRLRSFKHAFSGCKDILLTEHNAWVHAAATIVVVLLALWLKIPVFEFAFIIMAVTLVWVAEAFNTVVEVIVNMVSPGFTQVAKRAKDIAAGAVLFAAIGAALLGIVVLGPPLLKKFGL